MTDVKIYLGHGVEIVVEMDLSPPLVVGDEITATVRKIIREEQHERWG
jgi:hypothetical protein